MSKSSTLPSSPKAKKSTSSSKKSTWLWVTIAAAIVLIGIFGVFILFPSSDQVSATTLPAEITVDEAYEKYENGVYFLDVRTPEEWVEYHAPNTTLIPLDQLEARVNEVPHDQEVVVVCRSGNRSQVGRDILRQAGHDQVTSMAGGLKAWQASGYPTTSGP